MSLGTSCESNQMCQPGRLHRYTHLSHFPAPHDSKAFNGVLSLANYNSTYYPMTAY